MFSDFTLIHVAFIACYSPRRALTLWWHHRTAGGGKSVLETTRCGEETARPALRNLSHETSAEEWYDIPDKEQERLLMQLGDTREKREVVRRIPTKNAAIDVSNVRSGIHPEVSLCVIKIDLILP